MSRDTLVTWVLAAALIAGSGAFLAGAAVYFGPAWHAPLTVASLNASSLPGGTLFTLILKNSDSAPISNISSKLLVRFDDTGFSWVNMYRNASSVLPLDSGQLVTFALALQGVNLACGAEYSVSVSGTFSDGSSFSFVTSHPMDCFHPG